MMKQKGFGDKEKAAKPYKLNQIVIRTYHMKWTVHKRKKYINSSS